MTQPLIVEQIQALTEAAVAESIATDQLSDLLCELTSELETHSYAALAFVSETAAKNCLYCPCDEATKRFAIVDLCERLLHAVNSSEPFDFEGIDPNLQWMLLTPHDQAVKGGNASPHPVVSTVEQKHEESDGDVRSSCQCTDPELLDEFLTEADEHLDQAEQLILTLEENPKDSEAINGIFRAVHSLKGSSGILGLVPLAKLSHVAESMLVCVRDGALELNSDVSVAVLASMDYLRRQLQSIRESKTPEGRLTCLVAPKDLFSVLNSLTDCGRCDRGLLEQLRKQKNDQETGEATPTASSASSKQESLRVDGKRLQQLIDLIGELVITEAAVAQELAKIDSLTASSASTRLRKVVRDVQQLSLGLKMVPIGTILTKMNRMVRDVSEQLGKPCRFVIDGGDTEVDKTLLEGLADPLVHLIRNSLDHGIETAVSDRLAAGKPATATIRISAEHRAGSIVITIADDGRGLNRQRIWNVPRRRELFLLTLSYRMPRSIN